MPSNPKDLELRPFQILDKEWALLVSGHEKPNPMTVSWGGFGTLWNKPTVTVYIRPTRYTHKLLDQSKEFTLNFFEERFREAMDLCGSQSGRDIDKWKATGLHTVAGETVAVPRIQEANLSFECRVMAYQDFDPEKFVRPEVHEIYPQKDYHRIYWGEVLGIFSERKAS
ncbi:MAG: flavin reductase family protein [Pseudomonadota bacterium]